MKFFHVCLLIIPLTTKNQLRRGSQLVARMRLCVVVGFSQPWNSQFPCHPRAGANTMHLALMKVAFQSLPQSTRHLP